MSKSNENEDVISMIVVTEGNRRETERVYVFVRRIAQRVKTSLT